jgi:hypothetical protein
MHPIRSIRLLRAAPARKVAPMVQRRLAMNTTPQFSFLDDVLFVLALFVPVSVLLSGSFALAAIGSI